MGGRYHGSQPEGMSVFLGQRPIRINLLEMSRLVNRFMQIYRNSLIVSIIAIKTKSCHPRISGADQAESCSRSAKTFHGFAYRESLFTGEAWHQKGGAFIVIPSRRRTEQFIVSRRRCSRVNTRRRRTLRCLAMKQHDDGDKNRKQ